MATESEVERLIGLLGSSRTRAQARHDLAQMGQDAAPRLLRVLEEPSASANERWAAISLLGGCVYEPAAPALLKVMRRDAALRTEALRALKSITGKDLGDDVEAWETALGCSGEAIPPAPSVPEAVDESVPVSPELQLVIDAVGDLADSIDRQEPDSVCVAVPAGAAAPRRILVTFGRLNRRRRAIVSIHTDCGPADPTAQAVMFRHNVTFRYGTYSVEKDDRGVDRAVLRFDVSSSRLTPVFLRDVIMAMVGEVEQLDSELRAAESSHPWRATPPSGSR